jgi:hypothetical protein
MDCDQVFVILTRGPFPTGEAWDEEVEVHLESCADCWRLAEALRPALEVFQEAVPPAESRELPGYWGDARPAAAVVAELNRSGLRVATATGVRRITQNLISHDDHRLTNRFSAETLRAVVLAATCAATAVGFGLVWWAAQ